MTPKNAVSGGGAAVVASPAAAAGVAPTPPQPQQHVASPLELTVYGTYIFVTIAYYVYYFAHRLNEVCDDAACRKGLSPSPWIAGREVRQRAAHAAGLLFTECACVCVCARACVGR